MQHALAHRRVEGGGAESKAAELQQRGSKKAAKAHGPPTLFPCFLLAGQSQTQGATAWDGTSGMRATQRKCIARAIQELGSAGSGLGCCEPAYSGLPNRQTCKSGSFSTVKQCS